MLRPEQYKEEVCVQPSPFAPGSKLVGLLCPNCRTMCKGVTALQEHLKVCKGGAGASSAVRQPPSNAGPAARDIEEPQECHICDEPFKSHRTLDNHMKKQHGLSTPPRQMSAKGRGRPKKSPAAASGDWGGDGGYDGGYQDVGVAQPLQRGRPVGQVAPVRVGDGHVTNRASQPSTSAAGDPVRALAANRGRGRGQPPAGRGQIRRPGGQEEDKPDLQKLGMKFGGQISITSSNQPQGKKSGSGDGGQGLSVMKMKGNEHVGGPVSIKDATSNSNKNGSRQPSSSGESSKADSAKAETQSLTAQPRERTVKARGRPKKSPAAAPGDESSDGQDDVAPQKRPRISRTIGIQRISNYELESEISDGEECPICDKKYFNSNNELKKHMKLKHKIL